ncbi:MAG: DNA-primase RepB domain-containing protein [Candidatus Binataceae bacterium]
MNASITEIEVRQQLAAMGCERVDLGALSQSGWMLLAENCSAALIPSAIKWLRRENACGVHIFIRPSGVHRLSLVDDLTADAIFGMKRTGFQPALVVETSPQNFQAWLNHGRVLDSHTSTYAARKLARRFGGDPSSADWRHFGRLAGFTNQKLRRRLANGYQPFVKLREFSGRTYAAAEELIDEVIVIAQRELAERDARRSFEPVTASSSIKAIRAFHDDPRYGGDLHRADLAWAIYATCREISEQQIRDEILYARDLSKKGKPARQLDYVERTALKALAVVSPRR